MTPAGLVPAESGRWRLGHLGPRSLTARLVSGVVVLVVLLVIGIGAGTFFALKSFLYNRLDQQLNNTADQPISQLVNNTTFDPNPETIWLVQLDGNGAQLDHIHTASGPVRHMELSRADRLALGQPSMTPHTVHTVDGYSLRVVSLPQHDLAGVIVIGLSTDELSRTMHRLVILELMIGGAAVLIALFATTYGVRFSLRRLRQVTTTANEVAAELSPTGTGLERRVDVEDDGTEVGQLAQSMNTLLSAVETQFAARLESEERLRQFLADASHELRTPLTSIRGYAELARMQKAAGTSSEDNLARIESEGTRMSRLVEDLLLLARDHPNAEPRIELIDVAELVDDAVTGTRAAFPDRRIDTSLAAGLNVIGDHDQLLRAVRNLLTNAAVHTAPDRPILARCAPHGDQVVIQICDGGPGLPPDQAARVFERFWRADKARSRARGGSGLGMSIVATIVAANNGSVRFDSSVEHGSTVTITLPAVD